MTMQLANGSSVNGENRTRGVPYFTKDEEYVISDLKAGPQLNGMIVKCFAFLPDIARVIVVLPQGGLELSVHPTNLRPPTGGDIQKFMQRMSGGTNAGPSAVKRAGSSTLMVPPPVVNANLAKSLVPVTKEELHSMLISRANRIEAEPHSPAPYFTRFIPSKEATAHVIPLVEPEPLATCASPVLTYKLRAEHRDITQAQIQFVRTAQQCFDMKLPSGARAGFFLADGWGTGKTRALCQLIMENTLNGRRRHLWLTASPDQFVEVQQELRKVSDGRITAFQVASLEYESLEDLGYREGVCFGTYALFSLQARRKSGITSRLEQMTDWVSGNAKGISDSYEGVIIFDEWARIKQSTKDSRVTTMALNCDELQKRLPQARVVYVSSSLLYSPRELNMCSRLGLCAPALWQSFLNDLEYNKTQQGYEEFLGKLKSSGRLFARFLSFHQCYGQVYDINIPQGYVDLFSASYLIWSEIWASITESTRDTYVKRKSGTSKEPIDVGSESDQDNEVSQGANSAEKGELTKFFWNNHATYFRSLALYAKLADIKLKCKEELKQGHKVVLSFFHVGDEPELLSPAAILHAVCGRLFPESKPVVPDQPKRSTRSERKRGRPEAVIIPEVRLSSVKLDQYGLRVMVLGDKPRYSLSRGVIDHAPQRSFPKREMKALKPRTVEDDESMEEVEYFDEPKVIVGWSERIARIPNLPSLNILDMLLRELGGSEAVAEVTARKVRTDSQGQTVRRGDDDIQSDRAEFARGAKRICLLADSQASGISLHAVAKSGTSHIFAEFPLLAYRAVLHATRTFRAGAVHPAKFVFLTAPFAGDRHLAFACWKIFIGMGMAEDNMKLKPSVFYYDTQRAKYTLDFLIPTIYNTGQASKFKETMSLGDRVSRDFLAATARLIESLGWSPKFADRRADSGKKFLLRLIGLPVEYQENIFQLFANLMEQLRAAKKIDIRPIWED